MTANGGYFYYMIFNGHSDDQDICTLADDLVNTTDSVFPLKQKARYANKSMRTIWSWIFDAYGGWQFDDANNTDLPRATTALVASQSQYTLPTDLLTVRGVEVKDTGGTWKTLSPITDEQIREVSAEQEFMNTPSDPMYYTLYDGVVELYPAPNYSQNASLRMLFDRGMATFSSTDTTQEPGFATEFHEAVSTGMAMEFSRAKRMDSLAGLIQDWRKYENDIKSYYSARWAERNPPRMTTRDALADYQ